MITIKIVDTSKAETLSLLGRITYTESHGQFITDKSDLFHYNNKAFSVENITNSILAPNNVYFIIYKNDFPAGYAKLVFNALNENVKHSSICRLERIYILNEFIHLKLGQKLLDEVLHYVKKMSYNVVWLTTYIKNDRAIHFYEKNQFSRVGKYDFIVGNTGYENIVFEKQLTKIKH